MNSKPSKPLRIRRPITGSTIAAILFLVISVGLSAWILRGAFQAPALPTVPAAAEATDTAIVVTSDSGASPEPSLTTVPPTLGPNAEITIELAAMGDAAISDDLSQAITVAMADSPLRYALGIEQADVVVTRLPAANELAGSDLLITSEVGEDGLIKLHLIARADAPMLQVDSAPTPWNVIAPETFAIYSPADDLRFVAEAATLILEMQVGQTDSAARRLDEMRLVLASMPAPYGASQIEVLTFLQGVMADDVLALRLFSTNIRADEGFIAAQLNRGNAYLRLGDAVSALRDYEAVLERDPLRVEALYNEAVAYEQIGDLDSAKLATLELVRLLPDAAWVVNLQGGMYYRQQEWAQAVDAFIRARQLAPEAEIPLFNLARAEYQIEDYAASIRDYEALIAIAPDNASYRLHEAMAYEGDDNPSQAERALTQAIRIQPDFIEAYLMRGNLHLQEGRLDKATADAEMVLSLDDENGRAYALIGDVLVAQEEWWGATEAYTEAINAGYADAEVYAGRGYAWHQLLYSPYAARDYEMAIELGKTDPDLIFRLGFALLDVGRFEDALTALVGAMNAGIDTPEAYAALALALDANFERDEADVAYERAIELDARYGDLEFLQDQPLWSQASINRARTIIRRLE